MKKTLVSLALLSMAGLASAGVAVPAPQVITADTASYGGYGVGTGSTFAATKFTGSYNEVVTIGALGQVSAAAVAIYNAAYLNAGMLGGGDTGLGQSKYGYDIVATFESTAQADPSTQSFSGLSGNFQLWLAPLDNHGNIKKLPVASIDSNGNPTISSVVGDTLLGTSSTMVVTGAGASAGNTSITDSFTFNFSNFVVASDQSYFNPINFPTLVSTVGTIVDLSAAPGTYKTVSGDLNLTFGNAVPEPESLALVGLGLLGLVASRRRKTA